MPLSGTACVGRSGGHTSQQSGAASTATEQLGVSVSEIARQMEYATRAADAAGRSSSELLDVAHSISSQASDLNSRVDAFLQSVRAM